MTKRKTTPHLKPGPKPKPKPPKRSKGRPKTPLRDHPDRYTVARFDVADTWLKKFVAGERLSAALVLGVGAVHRRRNVDELRIAADRLRVMARRYQKPDDMKWRRAVAKAVGHTLIGAAAGGEPEPGRISLIMEYAAAAGEAEWVEREVLPLITLKSPSPDFDPLMLLAGAVASIGWASDIRRWMAVRDARAAPPVIEGIFPPA